MFVIIFINLRAYVKTRHKQKCLYWKPVVREAGKLVFHNKSAFAETHLNKWRLGWFYKIQKMKSLNWKPETRIIIERSD